MISLNQLKHNKGAGKPAPTILNFPEVFTMIRNPKMLACKFFLLMIEEMNKSGAVNPSRFIHHAIEDWNTRRGDYLLEYEIERVYENFVPLVTLMPEETAIKTAKDYMEEVKEFVPTIYKWEVKGYIETSL